MIRAALLSALRGFTVVSLSLALNADGSPPSEFRIFTPGWNDTTKGRFLFDAKAAKEVMASYVAHGCDVMIDLEHGSLDPQPSPDPTSRDARGWCQLQLRPDGSLWATNVSWTEDGATRLTQKRQRYVSPAFGTDKKSGRITSILNIAITSIPATHNTPALVAASDKGLGMDPSLVAKALDALEKGDSKAALEILKGLIASAAGGGASADSSTTDPTDSSTDVNAAAAAGGKGAAPPMPPAEKSQEVAAASARLIVLTGKTTLVEAVSEVEVFRKSHIELEAGRAQLAQDRATLESAERRRLGAELVTLGAEFPSTIWADDKATTLKSRWSKMEITELRAHVAEQRAARGGVRPNVQAPPTQQNGSNGPQGGEKSFTTRLGVVTLSARELAACAEVGAKPEDYAENKAVMRKARGEAV